ncbi:hypothetical protein AYI69_g7432 [Smittium culicis]|uniref:Uncharacterized protein n=1 Tax=Smittium culicis TaxID=133412 RepID=A0A1R1XS54_9FUNG|nr:hypothetical protein AYI69_g7977 [Smittium culicis]OMJ17445.1 hypothetical protein AYI69_g7432 [Smittium culicis]
MGPLANKIVDLSLEQTRSYNSDVWHPALLEFFPGIERDFLSATGKSADIHIQLLTDIVDKLTKAHRKFRNFGLLRVANHKNSSNKPPVDTAQYSKDSAPSSSFDSLIVIISYWLNWVECVQIDISQNHSAVHNPTKFRIMSTSSDSANIVADIINSITSTSSAKSRPKPKSAAKNPENAKKLPNKKAESLSAQNTIKKKQAIKNSLEIRRKKELAGNSKENVSDWYRDFLLEKFSNDFKITPKKDLVIVETEPSAIKDTVNSSRIIQEQKSTLGSNQSSSTTSFGIDDRSKKHTSIGESYRFDNATSNVKNAVSDIHSIAQKATSLDASKMDEESVSESDSELDSDLDDIVWQPGEEEDDDDDDDDDESGDEYSVDVDGSGDCIQSSVLAAKPTKKSGLDMVSQFKMMNLGEKKKHLLNSGNVSKTNVSAASNTGGKSSAKKRKKSGGKSLSEFGNCYMVLDQLCTDSTNRLFGYLKGAFRIEDAGTSMKYIEQGGSSGATDGSGGGSSGGRFKQDINDAVVYQQQKIFENSFRSTLVAQFPPLSSHFILYNYLLFYALID